MVELSPRTDGARYRRVTLELEGDGAVTLNAHETGGGLRAAWGEDDAEVSLRVPAGEAPRLALALAAEILVGGKDAAARLAAICEAHGVSFQIASWT